jgi:hypothetical protein
MDLDSMSRDELIQQLRELNEYMDNVIVFWGGKRELRETLTQVAANEGNAYTEEEAQSAKTLVENEEAFDEFIQVIRDSFELGGISYAISEKMSAIMEEVAARKGLH